MVWTTDRLVDSDVEDEVERRIPAMAPGRRTRTMALAPVQRRAQGDLPIATSADVQWASDRARGPEVAPAGDDPFDFRFPAYAGTAGAMTTGIAQRRATDNEATPDAAVAGGLASSGQPLDDKTRALMEKELGHDLRDVRVHIDGSAGASARSLHADAYTTGRDVVFAPGKYDPGSASGLQLLGHELTHVVQQSQGRAPATTQAKGVALNNDAGLEREADERGAAIAEAAGRGAGSIPAGESCPTCGGASVGGGCTTCGGKTGTVQRQVAADGGACHGTNRTAGPQHEAIQAHYTATVDPTGVREYAIPGSSASGRIGYADIASLGTGAIYEIKPNTPNEIADGLTQVARYVAAATASCGAPPMWHPGFAYPDAVIPFGNLELVAKQYNYPGLILYSTRPKKQQPQYERVVEVVLELGLSLALIVVIIAALADPEPATKLGLAGLSAEMIETLLAMLGMAAPAVGA